MTDYKNKNLKVLIGEILLWIFLVFLDQITKILAVDALKGKSSFPLREGVLEFHYLENHGAAFSLFQDAIVFFFCVAVFAMAAIAYFLYKAPTSRRILPLRLCLVLISAGAMGNLIDRMSLRYVRDFIYFSLIDFPVFNVADIYVTCATFVLVILILFVYKDSDFSFIQKEKASQDGK